MSLRNQSSLLHGGLVKGELPLQVSRRMRPVHAVAVSTGNLPAYPALTNARERPRPTNQAGRWLRAATRASARSGHRWQRRCR